MFQVLLYCGTQIPWLSIDLKAHGFQEVYLNEQLTSQTSGRTFPKIIYDLVSQSLSELANGSATATVPGNANLNLAGRASGYTCCSGDAAPAQSPTLVSGLTLVAGNTLTFSASGEVSYSGAASGRNNPDGIPYLGVPRGFGDGISSPTNLNRVNALVGLFLGDGSPTATTAPLPIDYAGGLSFPSTLPQLGQIFYIGNGLSGDTNAGDFGGTAQSVTVPTGATRLYLGTTDGDGWYNNTGSFGPGYRPWIGFASSSMATSGT